MDLSKPCSYITLVASRSPLILFFLLFLFPFLSPAQDLGYARRVVDTLASPSMHGRGYVKDGDKIAAAYIENEFKKFGLKPFGESYRQEFTLNVNTITDNAFSIYLKGEKGKGPVKLDLEPGRDYLVEAYSSSSNMGENKPVAFDSSQVNRALLSKLKQKKYTRYPVVLDLRNTKTKERWAIVNMIPSLPYKLAGVVILTDKKLTWDVAMDTALFPVITVNTTQAFKASDIDLVYIGIQNKFISSYKTQNLIGYIPGTEQPDSFIVFSAHYDHLGVMGIDYSTNKEVYFPGANDNASGTAMLLNLAKYYSENKPKYSVAFMSFGAEEAGIVGSHYYTEHPLFPLSQIKFLINIDLAGTGDEGVTVVNGSIYQIEFKTLQVLNAQGSYLKDVKVRDKAANSDHYFFTEKGVKAFFIYTMGGIKAYHDIYDRGETLPLTEFGDFFLLLRDFEGYLEHLK